MKPAGDERADEVEAEDERPLGAARLQDPARLQEPHVGGDAGVGDHGHVFAPAEPPPQVLHQGEGRAVGEVRRRRWSR